jgi:hypothetical protein
MAAWIDHVCIATRNLYQGADNLREETGLDTYDAGWFTGRGMAQRVAPLGRFTFIEINSVIDLDEAKRHFYSKWYEAVLSDAGREDRFIGFEIAVDTVDELQAIADRLNLSIASAGEHHGDVEVSWDHRLPSGRRLDNLNVPNDRNHQWPHGRPMFMLWKDKAGGHPDTIPEAATVAHRVHPSGIAWVEVGDEALTRPWVGPEGDQLDIRYVDAPAGLYAVGIRTDNGEIVVRRKPAPLSLSHHYTP